MKKPILSVALTCAFTFSAITGCHVGGGVAAVALPNVADFLLKASSSFIKNGVEALTIVSSSLGSGTFTVNFSISGANNLANQTATLIMNGGSGTFSTPNLPIAGANNITINSISNSAGGSANVTTNNSWSFQDSLGLMTYTYTPHGGAAQSLRAIDVSASLAGMLTIHSVIWKPNLTTVDLHWDYYPGGTGTVSFDASDLTSDANSTFNGAAAFGIAGSGITVADLSQHGTITILTTAPLLTGNFKYTNTDSSVVQGTFSCPQP